MFVFFDSETLAVRHIVTLAPPEYRDFISNNPVPGEEWIETDTNWPLHEIEVLAERTVRRREPMELTYPATAKVGEECVIAGLPRLTRVFVNGVDQGDIGLGSTVEFTPETGGIYRFRFERTGYITQEITIEATA